jgi:hypothetical protein
MNDQKINIVCGSRIKGGLASIDRRTDAMNLFTPLHLQAVLRGVDKISKAQVGVEIRDELKELHWSSWCVKGKFVQKNNFFRAPTAR